DTAGPKDRDIAFGNLYCLAEIRRGQVSNADVLWVTHVHRCAMHRGVARGNAHGIRDLVRGQRTHGDHHRPGKYSGGCAWDRSLIHRHIASLLDVLEPDAV